MELCIQRVVNETISYCKRCSLIHCKSSVCTKFKFQPLATALAFTLIHNDNYDRRALNNFQFQEQIFLS
jgi:hypothetical protein